MHRYMLKSNLNYNLQVNLNELMIHHNINKFIQLVN